MQQRARYDVDRIVLDAQRRGWLPIDLFRKAKISHTHGYRFLRGERNTPRIAAKLSKALGKGPAEYLIENQPERVA